jgi:hypothetical protein
MNVRAANCEFMVPMLHFRKAAGELPLVMVIDKAEAAHAVAGSASFDTLLLQDLSQNVPECLGTIAITPVAHPFIEPVGKQIVQ